MFKYKLIVTIAIWALLNAQVLYYANIKYIYTAQITQLQAIIVLNTGMQIIQALCWYSVYPFAYS